MTNLKTKMMIKPKTLTILFCHTVVNNRDEKLNNID